MAQSEVATTEGVPTVVDERRPPEQQTKDPVAWVRANLFNNVQNSILTVVFGGLVAFGIYRAIRFVFFTARWEIIDVNLTNLMVFRWPNRPDLIRPWVALFIGAATIGYLIGRSARTQLVNIAEDKGVELVLPGYRSSLTTAAGRLWPLILLIAGFSWFSGSPVTLLMLIALAADIVVSREIGLRTPNAKVWITYVIAGGGAVAAYSILSFFGGDGYAAWGGLMLTLFLAAGGIILSFPFGVALALGRRSSFPVVRWFCTGYIELIRGVPLITLLFMGSLLLGLFLPQAIADLERVTRALVPIIMFTAAYVAEIVRGGLQSVPIGQIEAAQALGLKPVKQTRLIVLPQALRNVIPALVGQFISLFKDTSLVAIVGLFELFGVAQAITSQGSFAGQGLLAETLVFVSFVYWVFDYTMSRESQRLEKRLGVGVR